MAMPGVSTEAPDFELDDQAGQRIRLTDLRGNWVVIYFYPKDNTPGCTKEACNFRDNFAAIKALGAEILGVSADSRASHEKFAAKFELPFSLLVDADHAVARAYGAFGLKKNYGREYEGIIRSTVIVDREGKIAKTFPRVKPAEHGDEVLAWLKDHTA